MTGINKGTIDDRLHEHIAGAGIPDRYELALWAVEETLGAVIEYIEAAKRHLDMTAPDCAVHLDVLIAEMKRDFEIHD